MYLWLWTSFDLINLDQMIYDIFKLNSLDPFNFLLTCVHSTTQTTLINFSIIFLVKRIFFFAFPHYQHFGDKRFCHHTHDDWHEFGFDLSIARNKLLITLASAYCNDVKWSTKFFLRCLQTRSAHQLANIC